MISPEFGRCIRPCQRVAEREARDVHLRAEKIFGCAAAAGVRRRRGLPMFAGCR